MSETYDAAKAIVAMLETRDVEGAVSLLGAYVDPERAEIVNKSIALGADPDLMAQIVQMLGSGEVIEVVGTAPSSWRKKFRPATIAAAVIGLGAGLVAYSVRHK